MTSQIEKTPNSMWKEKEAIVPTPNIRSVKSAKRLKSPKKTQDCKKSANDLKIEDVFLNSEYFKHQSNNISSLSFCSGDNGENQWTIESKFEMPTQQKPPKRVSFPNESIKSDTAVLEKTKVAKNWQQKLKPQPCLSTENPQEKTNKFLEGILSGKGRLDRDLITLITEQMFQAERELQVTRTHLIETISKLNERDLEILQLHEKIQSLQSAKKSDNSKKQAETSPSKTSEDYQRLILASEKLKKQVKDMEDFLNDYGLVWVGDKAANQKPDFDRIVKSFQRLNSVASEPKIIQTTMGAKFEVPHQLPVVLYSNGVLLRNKEFREYENTSTVAFLKDVEDGYFPSELQSEFPEGVPFEVTDKRHETYTADSKTQIFQGHGNRLGSTNEGKPSSLVFLEPLKKIRNHDSHTSFIHDNPCDRTLLKKLHKKRPRNVFSQVHPDSKQPPPPPPTAQSFHSPYPQLQEDRHHHVDTSSHHCLTETPEREYPQRQQLLNVKVRFGGDKTESFVLQFPENEKMFTFQRALQEKLCERFHDECLVTSDTNNKTTDFEVHIYGRSPFRLSENLNQYPADCGLVNNCAINVTEI